MSLVLPMLILPALALLLVLRRPLLHLFRLLLRSAAALAVLALLRPLGLSVGVNWLSGSVLGLLGLPGFGLLLLLPWLVQVP